MIKLDLRSIDPEQSGVDFAVKLSELYGIGSDKVWHKFTHLSRELLTGLISEDVSDLESIADHLAVSCETADDLKNLMYNTGALMHELNERLIEK